MDACAYGGGISGGLAPSARESLGVFRAELPQVRESLGAYLAILCRHIAPFPAYLAHSYVAYTAIFRLYPMKLGGR